VSKRESRYVRRDHDVNLTHHSIRALLRLLRLRALANRLRAIDVVEITRLRSSSKHDLLVRKTFNKECDLVLLFDFEVRELATSTIRAMRDRVRTREFEDSTSARTTSKSKERMT